MSAPETNLKKQEKRHAFPLIGMGGAVILAALLLIGLVVYLSASGNEPGNDTPIEAEAAASGADVGTAVGTAADD